MKNKVNEIPKTLDWIKDGARIINVMKRKKEGGPTRTDRSARRFVSLGRHQFDDIFNKANSYFEPGYRIYCTINSRDMEKGIRNFKQMILDNDYQDQESKYNFYTDIWNRVISSLQRPSARKEKLFLIDIDDDDRHGITYKKVKKSLSGVKIICEYRTKNGWHLITEPFEFPKITPFLVKWDHIKTDGMALLRY